MHKFFWVIRKAKSYCIVSIGFGLTIDFVDRNNFLHFRFYIIWNTAKMKRNRTRWNAKNLLKYDLTTKIFIIILKLSSSNSEMLHYPVKKRYRHIENGYAQQRTKTIFDNKDFCWKSNEIFEMTGRESNLQTFRRYHVNTS